MFKEKTVYYFLRILIFFLSFFNLFCLRFLAKNFAFLAYIFLFPIKKRVIANLALANDLRLSEKELKKYCRKAFENIAIVLFEYPYFSRRKNIIKSIRCENSAFAENLYKQGQGIIFFCGHLANWETLFLDGNLKMRGLAPAKPIKNKLLYHWIVKLRQSTGGKIITPKEALKAGIRALKEGKFVGLVADQAMPENDYTYKFLGRKSYSSDAAALLALKTKSPIIVATAKRHDKGYTIHYSEPLWPNFNNQHQYEVKRLMDQAFSLFENAVRENPSQWFWLHNRWKCQTPKEIYKKFRFENILITLPQEKEFLPHLNTLKEIYPKEELRLLIPDSLKENHFTGFEVELISDLKQASKKNYAIRLVLDLAQDPALKKLYQTPSAKWISWKKIKEEACKNSCAPKLSNISEILKLAILRSKKNAA